MADTRFPRRAIRACRRGSTATTFALSLTALVAAAGAAVDYARMSMARESYQSAADAAALAAAKEFRLGNAVATVIRDVATAHARNTLGAEADAVTISPSVDDDKKTVTVAIERDMPTTVMGLLGKNSALVRASATAQVVGGAPICVIGLDSGANFTVALDMNAALEAPGCAVYSNSTKANGLIAKNRATINAAFICTAGGKDGAGPGSFTPSPQTDCPVIADPLAARPAPHWSGCDHLDLTVNGGAAALMPGTYCGGITVTGGARVTLAPGVYVLKDGPLAVGDGGSLEGQNVGIHLAGAGSVLRFDANSSIALSAPATGEMAGILVFEDRKSPSGQLHEINSNDARMLLGTIYLPMNRLHVAADSPVADQSAYTIVVARLFTLSAGPTMVLNSNYASTNIPVPAGLGPNSNKVALAR